MGYPRDLDEYTEEELTEELTKRKLLRSKGKCDYCERPRSSTPCKFFSRHNIPLNQKDQNNES